MCVVGSEAEVCGCSKRVVFSVQQLLNYRWLHGKCCAAAAGSRGLCEPTSNVLRTAWPCLSLAAFDSGPPWWFAHDSAVCVHSFMSTHAGANLCCMCRKARGRPATTEGLARLINLARPSNCLLLGLP